MRFRKGQLFVLAFLFLALVSASVGKAYAAVFQFGLVTGSVSNTGSPVVGANVNVTCNSNTLSTTTNASGVYVVQYSNVQCPIGQNVTVTASSGALAGTNSGTMTAGSTYGGVEVDVAVVNVPLIPEFGLIVGSLTALGSAGLFILKRKI